jgi:hypothetical protein
MSCLDVMFYQSYGAHYLPASSAAAAAAYKAAYYHHQQHQQQVGIQTHCTKIVCNIYPKNHNTMLF